MKCKFVKAVRHCYSYILGIITKIKTKPILWCTRPTDIITKQVNTLRLNCGIYINARFSIKMFCIYTRGPNGLTGPLNIQLSFQQLSCSHFSFGEYLKFDLILPVFAPLWAPKGHSSLLCTSMDAVDPRVMHTKFGKNLPSTFREDVENTNFPYIYIWLCEI